MQKQQYKKVTFDFPAEEYVYLKMACVKQGVSMKDFLTKAVIKNIEEYEDELDVMALRKAKEENEEFISWEKAKKQLHKPK
jgi:ParG